MVLSLAIQNTYSHLELGLARDGIIYAKTSVDKTQASKRAIPALSSLINDHGLVITDLTYIAVNQGPGPFTTLRVTIATANGLAFATKIPLVGVDGLITFFNAHSTQHSGMPLALLDAFNNDLYVAYQTDGNIQRDCMNINSLLYLLNGMDNSLTFTAFGNGAELHRDILIKHLADRITIIDGESAATLEQISNAAYIQWQNDPTGLDQLFPLYLKQQQYKNQRGTIIKV